ncbi:hypothetical protein SALBM135S_05141 [Streptomyces alboniger]
MSASRLAERFAHCLRKPTPAEIPWHLLEKDIDLSESASEPTGAAPRL